MRYSADLAKQKKRAAGGIVLEHGFGVKALSSKLERAKLAI